MYKNYILLVWIVFLIYSCSDSNSIDKNDINISPSDDIGDNNGPSNPSQSDFNWIVPNNTVNGNFSPFPLSHNPTFSRAKDIDFISDESLVAMVSFKNEIRVYPYRFISRFESVNDVIDGNNIAMTYCPITESGLCWNRNFKDNLFVLRASGYLHLDNVVLHDKESDTFWSQMLVKCIKGTYAGEVNDTFNFIESTWKTVKDNFGDALVFTNTSTGNSGSKFDTDVKNKNGDIRDGEGVYGIINFRSNKKIKSEIHAYQYETFDSGIKLFSKNITNNNVIIIGSKDFHFITSYLNDRNNTFTAVQNEFPIVMKDDQNNKWNMFGIAVSGPRLGQQLKSPKAFVASWWSWNQFYDDFVFQN